MGQWYFKPRLFETRNSCAIYKYLGVRIYKKYLPTSGDLVTRSRGIKRLKVGELGRRKALEEHEKLTYKWERRHIVSAVLLQTWAVLGGVAFGLEHLWISSTINVFVNVYPILLQRYNRARIDLCLEKMPPNKSLQLTDFAGS